MSREPGRRQDFVRLIEYRVGCFSFEMEPEVLYRIVERVVRRNDRYSGLENGE